MNSNFMTFTNYIINLNLNKIDNPTSIKYKFQEHKKLKLL